MKKYLLAILALLVVVVFARLSLYTVDAAEYVYVTVLGQHPDWGTYDGNDPVNGAGLKFGWPWPIQQVQRLDRRLQQFDLPAFEQLTVMKRVGEKPEVKQQFDLPAFEQFTHDKAGNRIDKILLIEAYVCWKIADRDSVDSFVRRIGSTDRAREILAPRINSQLGAAIGERRMDDLINTSIDPTGKHTVDIKTEELRQEVLNALRHEVRTEYGIELIDIRLRRFNHPANVRDSIFQRIKSERNMIVADYDSKGKQEASKIASQTEEKVREMLARAASADERIKAEADAEAMKIRNQAYSQDREFYAYLKNLEMMQSILGDPKTMLLLSTNRPMFNSMYNPPRPQQDKKESK